MLERKREWPEVCQKTGRMVDGGRIKGKRRSDGQTDIYM